jgi:N-acetylmuramoyl-L-alanine amidase
MKKLIFLIMICTAFLFSCTKEVKKEALQQIPKEESAKQTVSINEVPVSSLAKEYYLEPLENYSWEREYAPEYIMLHFTSAVVLDKNDPYNMKSIRGIFEENKISINYIIDRSGEITCYIPENRCAWHAGKRNYKGIEKLQDAMNRYSIGIEIVAIGSENDMSPYFSKSEYSEINKDLIGFTEAQYQSLVKLLKDICERNTIPYDREHIIGHEEYKESKTDPGELFEWGKLF